MSIDTVGPSPEEMGLPTNEVKEGKLESKPKADYLPELGFFYGIGDQAVIHRSNGAVESDWKIKSFGEKSVVVSKEDKAGGSLQKVIQREEFCQWQKDSPQFRYNRRVEPHHASRIDEELKRHQIRLG